MTKCLSILALALGLAVWNGFTKCRPEPKETLEHGTVLKVGDQKIAPQRPLPRF